jgi:hypothetical protein
MSAAVAIPPVNTATEPRITPGALRMRASRQRRRRGLQCYVVDLHQREINRLIELGYLQEANRSDKNQVLLALYRFLDNSALGGAHRRWQQRQ